MPPFDITKMRVVMNTSTSRNNDSVAGGVANQFNMNLGTEHLMDRDSRTTGKLSLYYLTDAASSFCTCTENSRYRRTILNRKYQGSTAKSPQKIFKYVAMASFLCGFGAKV